MIYSLEERKVGSFFGEDLYEKCIEIDETPNTTSLEVEITGANKMVNAECHLFDNSGTHRVTNYNNFVTGLTGTVALNIDMFDYENESAPAIFQLNLPSANYHCEGFAKIQYTKLPTT